MLKPRAVQQVLRQATTGSVKATMLLNAEGSLIAYAADNDTGARIDIIAAISSSVWSTYDKNCSNIGLPYDTAEEGLRTLYVDCEEVKIAILTVSNMLLCLVAHVTADLGILKAKGDALARHLKEPLKQISDYQEQRD